VHITELKDSSEPIHAIDCHPGGRLVACVTAAGLTRCWDLASGDVVDWLQPFIPTTGDGRLPPSFALSWSPHGHYLASGAGGSRIAVWDGEANQPVAYFEPQAGATLFDGFVVDWGLPQAIAADDSYAFAIAWSPGNDYLSSAHQSGSVYIWDRSSTALHKRVSAHGASAYALAWHGRLLASGSADNTIAVTDVAFGRVVQSLQGHRGGVLCLAWSPSGDWLVSGSDDTSVCVWRPPNTRPSYILDGHLGPVTSVRFSPDGALLASKGRDGKVRLWLVDGWIPLNVFEAPMRPGELQLGGMAFADLNTLVVSVSQHSQVQSWKLDRSSLLRSVPTESFLHRISGKVVMVGDTGVGKSCLAMKLATGKYPEDYEQGTTHGLRFWRFDANAIRHALGDSPAEQCELVIWDFGGQPEYQLIHQLFLSDAAVAVVVFDATRGVASAKEVEAWSNRLSTQLNGQPVLKLLVAAKMDTESDLVSRPLIDALLATCGFDSYCETGAKSGRGVDTLLRNIVSGVNWPQLPRASRSQLAGLLNDVISETVAKDRALITVSELTDALGRAGEGVAEPAVLESHLRQLAMRGEITPVRLEDGREVLVLKPSLIEQYAGSLVLLARDNRHGIPALEARTLGSLETLPGIDKNRRLPQTDELIILEGVVELLIDHGICFRHQGLLIFPTLFRSTQSEFDTPRLVGTATTYDIAGPIDVIYASLIAWLVIAEHFGGVRLWNERAEFERESFGMCGIRRVELGRGLARFEVYFASDTPEQVRTVFKAFVEDHIRHAGVPIIETGRLACESCGLVFPQDVVFERLASGASDIGCSRCDARCSLGANEEGETLHQLKRTTWALKTEIESRRKKILAEVKREAFFQTGEAKQMRTAPIRILHLSDMHFTGTMDPNIHLRPLEADLVQELGVKSLDYLVISGDISNTAAQAEYEKATEFLTQLITTFSLSAERCMIVPGNHDVLWDSRFYSYRSNRLTSQDVFKPGTFVRQQDIVLVRDDKQYPLRFQNFSNYLYHRLLMKPFPLTYEDQASALFFPESGLQFIGLNSCWELDEWFPSRSSINEGALARVLRLADKQLRDQSGVAKKPAIRIAICHHPISGNEKIEQDAFLEQLGSANVQFVLHGHVHESRAEVIGYETPNRIRCVGAGSFSSGNRPESTPRLYNLIEITAGVSTRAPSLVDDQGRWTTAHEVKVNTRARPRTGGAWRGWAEWGGAGRNAYRPHYTFSAVPTYERPPAYSGLSPADIDPID
jgi:small GTP-binding protein